MQVRHLEGRARRSGEEGANRVNEVIDSLQKLDIIEL
jgi:hypothetical protein